MIHNDKLKVEPSHHVQFDLQAIRKELLPITKKHHSPLFDDHKIENPIIKAFATDRSHRNII